MGSRTAWTEKLVVSVALCFRSYCRLFDTVISRYISCIFIQNLQTQYCQ
jgi:hypothetical protein